MRERGNHQFTIFPMIDRAGANAAAPGFIDLANFLGRRNDLRSGRVVWRFDMGHQIRNAGLGVV